jgi:hypothetical protein
MPPQPKDLGAALQLKGKKAEEVVTQLAEKTFLVDWCFPNPHLPNGKELCDLLGACAGNQCGDAKEGSFLGVPLIAV